MAKVITGEVQIKTGAATKDVDNLRQGVENFNAKVVDANKKAIKGFKGLEKAVDKTSRGFKGLGIALKAAGIGLVAAAFAKLVEVFKENQLVVNAFNTTFEAVSLAFNDFSEHYAWNNTDVERINIIVDLDRRKVNGSK